MNRRIGPESELSAAITTCARRLSVFPELGSVHPAPAGHITLTHECSKSCTGINVLSVQ